MSIYCNYIEIYNEDVYDLLADEKIKKKLTVKERDKIFYVNNVTNKKIESLEDFSMALNTGVRKKTHAATSLNNNSSRSHTIFKIILQNNKNKTVSNISIVDLAGAERVKKAETQGAEFTESCKINQSLSVLGKCFAVLKENTINVNKKIVPFRESKLTMLFQEYFQGDESISIIGNINTKDDLQDIHRVLAYISSSKDINPVRSRIVCRTPFDANVSKITKINDDESLFNDIEDYTEENRLLVEQNNRLNDKYEEAIEEAEELQAKNEELMNIIENMKKEFNLRLINTRIDVVEKLAGHKKIGDCYNSVKE
jgi:kinesin family protein 20